MGTNSGMMQACKQITLLWYTVYNSEVPYFSKSVDKIRGVDYGKKSLPEPTFSQKRMYDVSKKYN